MLKERCSKVYPTSRGYKRIVGNNWLAHYYAVVAVRRGRPVSVAGEGHVRRNSRKLPLLKERQQAARGQIWRHSGRPAVAADGLVRWQAVRECAAALLLVAGRECDDYYFKSTSSDADASIACFTFNKTLVSHGFSLLILSYEYL